MKTIYLYIFLSVLSIVGKAESIVVDDISYEIKNSQAYVTSGTYSGDIIIPESIIYDGATYPVVGINDNAINGNRDVTSITIPASVISLGKNCINDLTLKSLVFSNGGSIIYLSGNVSKDAPIWSCTIDEVIIGRNFKISYPSSLFKSNKIKNVVFGSDITVVPSNIFTSTTLIDEEGKFEINEGIETIESNAFAIDGIQYLVLPSTLKELGSNTFDFLKDIHNGITLVSRSADPIQFASAVDLIKCFSSESIFKFEKLIIPIGTSEKYREANWFGILSDESMVEEVEMTQTDPGTSGDDDDDSKVYVSLTVTHSSGANSYPRIEINKGDDFSLAIDVDSGWNITSASFIYDSEAPQEERPAKLKRMFAESDDVPETSVEKLSTGSNRYRINVSGVNRDGHVSYVVEKEIPTDVSEYPHASPKPLVAVGKDVVKIIYTSDCTVNVYDLQGNLLRSCKHTQNAPVSFSGLSKGVYILQIGAYTYKVIL